MELTTVEEVMKVYYDIVHTFELQNRLSFEYRDLHSKENGLKVKYEKGKGVCYIPFIWKSYPITIKYII